MKEILTTKASAALKRIQKKMKTRKNRAKEVFYTAYKASSECPKGVQLLLF